MRIPIVLRSHRPPRWVRRAITWLTGTYWTPCHHCHRWYGGWEVGSNAARHIPSIPIPTGTPGLWSHAHICPDCTSQGVGCLASAAVGRGHAGCIYLRIEGGYEQPD
jgi:hypothetical protein